jgi:hypothetical protein
MRVTGRGDGFPLSAGREVLSAVVPHPNVLDAHPQDPGERHPSIDCTPNWLPAWLDENCAADGWAMTPSGTRGVLNDALSIYVGDATLASAFVARWCVGAKVETVGGVFQVREDQPEPRVGSGLHRTP